MEKTFRLEFSEEQQCFHLDDMDHEENTSGYVTIKDNCTESEHEIFMCFLETISAQVLDYDLVMSKIQELIYFWEALIEHGYSIQKL